MFCRNCGKEMADGSQFCPTCGAKPSDVATIGQPRHVAQGSVLNRLILTTASLLSVVSVIALVGTLSLSGRFITVKGMVNSLAGLANSFGLDTSDPVTSQVVRFVQTTMSGISKFIVFAGIGLFLVLLLMGLMGFLVVTIDRKVSNSSKPTDS